MECQGVSSCLAPLEGPEIIFINRHDPVAVGIVMMPHTGTRSNAGRCNRSGPSTRIRPIDRLHLDHEFGKGRKIFIFALDVAAPILDC